MGVFIFEIARGADDVVKDRSLPQFFVILIEYENGFVGSDDIDGFARIEARRTDQFAAPLILAVRRAQFHKVLAFILLDHIAAALALHVVEDFVGGVQGPGSV